MNPRSLLLAPRLLSSSSPFTLRTFCSCPVGEGKRGTGSTVKRAAGEPTMGVFDILDEKYETKVRLATLRGLADEILSLPLHEAAVLYSECDRLLEEKKVQPFFTSSLQGLPKGRQTFPNPTRFFQG